MKVLARKGITPCHLAPGDSLKVTYTDEHGIRSELVEHVCTEAEMIDTALICRLESEELGQLGLASGYAGVVGRA